MSLINQMLRDLDKRHALGNAQASLPEHVKPAQGHAAASMPAAYWLLGGVGLLAVAGGLHWYLQPAAGPSQPADPVPPAAAPASSVALTAGPDTPVPAAAAPITPVPPAPPTTAPGAETPRPSMAAALAVAPTKPEQATPGGQSPVAAEPPPAPKGMSLRLDSLSGRTPPTLQPKAKPEPSPSSGSVEKTPLPLDAPARLEQQYQEALARLNRGQVREAMDALRGLLRAAPAHADARQVLVRLLLEQGKSSEAMTLLQDLVRAGPVGLAVPMQLARLQVEYLSDEAAVQTLRAAAGAGSGDPDYHAFLATLLQRRQRHAEAVTEYRKALAIKPREGQWWAGLGMALEAGGSPEEALHAWRSALNSGHLNKDLREFIQAKLAGR